MEKSEKSGRKVLYKTGQLDCLSYYNRIFKKKATFLKKFLWGREIATKIYLPEYEGKFIVKRGSKETPLYISELLKNDRKKLMSLRKADDLKEVRDKLNSRHEKIWHYFVPRKMIEMHYAFNGEGKNKEIDRIFIDIDHGEEYSEEDARKVVLKLRKEIKKDKDLKKIINKNKHKERKVKVKVLWTGSGFHVYILLPDKMKSSFYKKHFSWGKKTRKTFIEKWAESVSESTGFSVEAAHERQKDKIILDTSGSPPGKLARAPYSLNLDENGEIKGICVPLDDSEIEDPKIVKKLRKLTPEIVSDY